MSESDLIGIEQRIGSEVDHFVYRVPKKNHDSMVQLNKQFAEIMRKYGAPHLIFQLNNTEAPMEGITNIAKTILANQDDEVWMELIFYRDRKHKDEVGAKMQNDAWADFSNSHWISSPRAPDSSWGSSAASGSR